MSESLLPYSLHTIFAKAHNLYEMEWYLGWSYDSKGPFSLEVAKFS